MDSRIVPECYIDTMLIETILLPKKRYNHQHGCSNVANEMEYNLRDEYAIGIVDDDKLKPKYFENFEQVSEYKGVLKLLRHLDKTKHHYLILIIPAIEEWIMNISSLENISIKTFDLPDTLKFLKRFTKLQTSSKDQRFIKLFAELKKSNNDIIVKLKNWIQIIQEKNYHLDINELENV